MTYKEWAQQVAICAGIELTDVYDADDQCDAGFAWTQGGIEYHVQVALYDDKPYLLHKNLPDGCIQMVNDFKKVKDLIETIKTL